MKNGLIITIAFISAIAICLLVLDNSTYAQNIPVQNITLGNSTLYVLGNAQATVKPDKVILSLSVETTNTTAGDCTTNKYSIMGWSHDSEKKSNAYNDKQMFVPE